MDDGDNGDRHYPFNHQPFRDSWMFKIFYYKAKGARKTSAWRGICFNKPLNDR